MGNFTLIMATDYAPVPSFFMAIQALLTRCGGCFKSASRQEPRGVSHISNFSLTDDACEAIEMQFEAVTPRVVPSQPSHIVPFPASSEHSTIAESSAVTGPRAVIVESVVYGDELVAF